MEMTGSSEFETQFDVRLFDCCPAECVGFPRVMKFLSDWHAVPGASQRVGRGGQFPLPSCGCPPEQIDIKEIGEWQIC